MYRIDSLQIEMPDLDFQNLDLDMFSICVDRVGIPGELPVGFFAHRVG